MYDFHSPKQKTAIGSQETEPRHSDIIQIDQNLLETRLERFDAEADEIAEAVSDTSVPEGGRHTVPATTNAV